MHKFIFALFISILSNPAFSAQNQKPWEVSHILAQPESVYVHAPTNSLFVSNIAGEGTEANGKGYISKLNTDGTIVEAKWISGLNAPKGMRSFKDFLYVSDITEVVKINLTTAKIIKKIPIQGAKFLNDIAVDSNGYVYVSDTLTSSIHVLKDDKTDVFVSGNEWESPNGLIVQNDSLIVAAWGFTQDFQNQTSGHLYKIHLTNKKRTNISQQPLGNLDGLEVDPTNKDLFYLSDWVTGEVFTLTNGKKDNVVKIKQGTADIGLFQDKDSISIVVPLMNDSSLKKLSF